MLGKTDKNSLQTKPTTQQTSYLSRQLILPILKTPRYTTSIPINDTLNSMRNVHQRFDYTLTDVAKSKMNNPKLLTAKGSKFNTPIDKDNDYPDTNAYIPRGYRYMYSELRKKNINKHHKRSIHNYHRKIHSKKNEHLQHELIDKPNRFSETIQEIYSDGYITQAPTDFRNGKPSPRRTPITIDKNISEDIGSFDNQNTAENSSLRHIDDETFITLMHQFEGDIQISDSPNNKK